MVPQGLVEHKGFLYVNQTAFINVVDPKGGEAIRTFSLAQPSYIRELVAKRRRCPLGIDDFSVANGRIYSRDGAELRVCDLDGNLMQSVELLRDGHGDDCHVIIILKV